MSKPTISLLGATYSDVSGVELPVSGGGTASFPFVEGSQTVTTNGTYDVTALASLIVNVSGGGGSGLEYETGTFETSTDVNRPAISFAKTHTKPPSLIVMADIIVATAPVTDSVLCWDYEDTYQLFGSGTLGSGTTIMYGRTHTQYRSGTSTGNSRTIMQYDYTDTAREDAISCTRYYARESAFYPYPSSTARYWRAGRTYKWIAVWI